jgi:hypothetical protein
MEHPEQAVAQELVDLLELLDHREPVVEMVVRVQVVLMVFQVVKVILDHQVLLGPVVEMVAQELVD